MLCLKIAGWVANSVDPADMPHSVASHLGLHCLLKLLYPNTYGIYGTIYHTWVKFEQLYFITCWCV